MEKQRILNPTGRRLAILCAAVYFCSYLTRLNYAAVMVEMITNQGFSRAGASAALTGLFISYAVGQLCSGFLGDRVPPQRLITVGLGTAAAMNLCIPFCPSTLWLTAVWCVNGAAQAMLWPPMVKILSAHLEPAAYKKASLIVCWGSNLGTIFVYLFTPLVLAVSDWRMAFFAPAAVAAVMVVIWVRGFSALQKRLTPAEALPSGSGGRNAAGGKLPRQLFGVLALVMLAIVFQGMLRDGISTWMPTYISETFHLESAVSVLTGVALPILNLGVYSVTMCLHEKVLKNEITCAGVIFAFGAVMLVLLRCMDGSSMVLSALALTMGSVSMHGVNLMLISILPSAFRRYGCTSFISGLLNSCTYVGSALSTYGVAVLTEACGWSATQLAWIFAGLAGTLCCLAAIRPWSRFRREKG